MESVSATASLNNTSWPSAELLSKAEGIAWCIAFAFEAAFIVAGNLLTILFFAVNKTLRKKSLFLVINMAFADLMLGAVSIPIYVFFTGRGYELWTIRMPMPWFIFSTIVENVFLYASVISAAFISGERFYAIYWPLKHRTLSMRAYGILIFMVWMRALLASLVFAFGIQLLFSKTAAYGLLLFFFIFIFVLCGCNIAIWRKFQHGSIGVSQQQNRASKIQRLTKTLLVVSLVALLVWLPSITMNSLLVVFEISLPWGIYLAALAVNFSNSFVNPILYALRIPEFRESLVLCCCRWKAALDAECNERRDNRETSLSPVIRLRKLRTEPSLLQLTFKQDIVDTKL